MSTASSPSPDPLQQVNLPATLLLVTGILGVVVQLGFMIFNFSNMYIEVPSMNVDAKGKMTTSTNKVFNPMAPVGIADNILCILIGGVIIFGSMKMKTLHSFGLSMTSSILAMIPCISPCCLMGLPIGIWAIVVLNKPEVKTAFR